jgi:hypothetical protein
MQMSAGQGRRGSVPSAKPVLDKNDALHQSKTTVFSLQGSVDTGTGLFPSHVSSLGTRAVSDSRVKGFPQCDVSLFHDNAAEITTENKLYGARRYTWTKEQSTVNLEDEHSAKSSSSTEKARASGPQQGAKRNRSLGNYTASPY